MNAMLIDRLKAILGPKGWIDDPVEQAPYLTEWRGLWRGATPLIVRPADTAQVAAIVSACAEAGAAIVPQGGNTGLVGGAIPEGQQILLNLGRMTKIRQIDPVGDTLIAEAGLTLAALQQAASSVGRLFPLRLASEGSSQLGGIISTNAGGEAVLRYGPMRDLVLGLEVVLADGRVWNGLRRLRKDNRGYDLKQLFIGGEGTLGIVTAACVKLFPAPNEVRTAWAVAPSATAAVALLALARTYLGDMLNAFELVGRPGLDLVLRHIPGCRDPLPGADPWALLIEASSASVHAGLDAAFQDLLADAAERGLVRDAVIAASLAQAGEFWRLRESMSEAQRIEGASIKHDISVPIAAVPDFLAAAEAAIARAEPAARVIAFGHVGDGNIHFNVMQPATVAAGDFLARWEEISRIVHDAVAGMEGSFSAEHGVGRLKTADLARYKSDVEIDLMRRVKSAIDPGNMFNPGKILP